MGKIIGLVIPQPEEIREAPQPENGAVPESENTAEAPQPEPEKKSAKK